MAKILPQLKGATLSFGCLSLRVSLESRDLMESLESVEPLDLLDLLDWLELLERLAVR